MLTAVECRMELGTAARHASIARKHVAIASHVGAIIMHHLMR